MKTLLVLTAALVALLWASSATAATLRLTPAKAPAGASVEAVGSGFPGGSSGTIVLGGRTVAQVNANGSGAFTVNFNVPRLPAGAKTVVARSGGARVASVFTIGRRLSSSVTAVSGGPRVLMWPLGGPSGTRVNLRGAGFPRGASVAILYEGSRRATARAAARGGGRGTFAKSFIRPPSPNGTSQIAVRWGSRSLGIPFAARGCGQGPVIVCLPFIADYSLDHGAVNDKDGTGTGFTRVDNPSSSSDADGYIQQNIDVAAGKLALTTTSGLAFTGSNSQDNMLAVGLNPGRDKWVVSTTLSKPPAGSGGNEQAGLWFGNDEKNYAKLVVLSSAPGTTKIQFLVEINDASQAANRFEAIVTGTSNAAVTLTLRANPLNRRITASYRIGGGPTRLLGGTSGVTAPAGFFSADQAGIDPTLRTNTFAGIFASHRNGSQRTYRFDRFAVTSIKGPPPPPPPVSFDFNEVATASGIQMPTGMVFGKNGRLYVTELLGEIHALTLNSAHKVTNDNVISSLTDVYGPRLTIGITLDPASTRSNTILWVTHSDPDLVGPDSSGAGGAPPNSSVVSRLSGPGFNTVATVIAGLPRSQANHTTNSLHFHRGKLYIAQAGNTGAGAPNNSAASLGEFGTRQEQRLSSAILVANVKAPGFDGTCHNASNIYGPAPCDVRTYATGFRNSYDFVWHSNGFMYAPDNGAAVGPTYPRSPTPPCNGMAPTSNSVPPQGDTLARVIAGRYYGHPNPSRNQCVFKNGSFQGVAPLPNFTRPIAGFPEGSSADGIIEYKGNAFRGRLKHNLIVTNYSGPGGCHCLTRVVLSANGKSVRSKHTLAGGPGVFNHPLPIVQGPGGVLYFGEFGANKITALVPAG